MATKTCRVERIIKATRPCDSRLISAELIDDEGEHIFIDWVKTPLKYYTNAYKLFAWEKLEAFEQAWESVKEGDKVKYIRGEPAEEIGVYFIPEKAE